MRTFAIHWELSGERGISRINATSLLSAFESGAHPSGALVYRVSDIPRTHDHLRRYGPSDPNGAAISHRRRNA